jgi:hypothetical protein
MLDGILPLLGVFILVLNRSHARNDYPINFPVFCPWILSRYRFRARLLAVTRITPHLRQSFGFWIEDSGNLKISPRHRNHDIAVFN